MAIARRYASIARPACRRLKDDAQVVVAVRAIGISARLRSIERDRFVAPSLLMRQDAGVVQRGGMIRGRLEHAAIQLLGLDELIVLLKQDRERDRLVERQLARRRSDCSRGGAKRSPASLTGLGLELLVGLDVVLEVIPASSDPSGFCGLYSRSTLANARLTVSES